jgi:hypothetical protein
VPNRIYAYRQTSDNRVGVVIIAGAASKIRGVSPEADLQLRAAVFLGFASAPSFSVVSRPTDIEWQLSPSVKLLENREAGAYLWEQKDGNERVDVRTRIPGWRFTFEYPGRLKPRGRVGTKTHEFWTNYLPADQPFIILAQVLFPDGKADRSLLITDLREDSRIFAIACWAPSEFYPKYEILFERVLSEFHVYDLRGFRSVKS